jgi:hypothetical protein
MRALLAGCSAGVVILSLCFASLLLAQTESASLSGRVTDPSGAVVPHVAIEAIENSTNIRTTAESNSDGLYYLSSLRPGSYRVVVSKDGFKQIIQADVVLHVQDVLTLNFGLQIGSVNESITVTGGALLVNTSDAAVSTVIDRNFVESLPLNGRSFNTLLQLTPGTVIAQSTATEPGQFSISGQRTSANDFTVDGASANFGVTPTTAIGASGTGTAQAFSALGGTSSLVSVEALQEFRIETSSFAPEFGHVPGGHVLLTTRSGTNEWHGGLYEYFRNDVLDANDWFAKQAGEPRATERHNDFGGYLGGPIDKNKTFVFLSYEGARLRLPLTSILIVPSVSARASATPGVQSMLNAFPLPNGPVSPDGQTAQFTGVYSNSAALNAGSIRVDHRFNDRVSLFGRYNDAPSNFVDLGQSPNDPQTTEIDTRTLTLGLDVAFTPQVVNSLRGNYSIQKSSGSYRLTSVAGGVPYEPPVLLGSLSETSNYVLYGTFDTGFLITGPLATNRNSQFEILDDVAVAKGKHQMKFGVDYRSYYLDSAPYEHLLEYLSYSLADLLSTSSADLFAAQTTVPSKLLSRSLSLYGQDSWKVTPRLALTYGLRWEFSPAPDARGNTTLAAWENVNDPSMISLAPPGTSVWKSTYGNFAPRFGLAYALTRNQGLVLRLGGGVFYDLGVGAASGLAGGFPNNVQSISFGVPIPVGNITPLLPVITEQPPYQGIVNAMSPDLKLPRSYQWSAGMEKVFLGTQALSVTYVGQAGRNLLRTEGLGAPNSNFTGTFYLTYNGASSDYNALQIQYRRPLANRVQALLNYTLSHALDNASNDTVDFVSSSVISAANDRASSDFDARHSFSGAITVSLPGPTESKTLAAMFGNWSVDSVVVARSAFPFNGIIGTPVDGSEPRPNRDLSQAAWISNPMAGGGRSLNPNAFSVPPVGVQGTEGRNDLRGFGLTQVDLSLARRFAITERVNLQFRTDAFNIFNHPNFTSPLGLIGSNPIYLSSESMLNHGLGGLNPLFQQGGPRSLQLSLKLTF